MRTYDYRTASASDRHFAISHPVPTGDIVMQGHADFCRDYGHATWTVTHRDGTTETIARCPRCGADN